MFIGVVIAIGCLAALLTFVWFSEVLAGCFALRKERTSPVAAPGTLSHKMTVLIPAHNEGAGILSTIRAGAQVRAPYWMGAWNGCGALPAIRGGFSTVRTLRTIAATILP
jgi:hypothetical protein